jgi:hypothetical protein
MTPATAKSAVLLASVAPVAVIFYRRNRLTTYCLLLDYERLRFGCRDHLSCGSRFFGRIFPERSHLSADGELLVYFAMRGRKTDGQSDPSTWTAVATPPWLKAHLFFPNGSTWGGGGMFLPGRRLVVLEAPPPGAGSAYETFREHRILHDAGSLPAHDAATLQAHLQPAKVTKYPWPLEVRGSRRPVIVRTVRSRPLSSYDLFDYVIQDADGYDIEGAEDIVLANWAGWDIYGRLMVVAGRHLKIYEIEPGRHLGKPTKTLDFEAVI